MRTWFIVLSITCANAVASAQTAHGTQSNITKSFLSHCKALAPMMPSHFTETCHSLANDKTQAQLSDYDKALVEIDEDLRKMGPDVAKHLIAKCAATATDKSATPRDLQFCLDTHSLDVQGISQGNGTSANVASLVAKVHVGAHAEPNSPGGPGWNSLSKEEKRNFRRAAVDACAAEAPPYVAAVCAGIGLHEEILADKPYGDNGEIAKQWDTLLHGFTAAGSAQNKANEFASKALIGIGVPAAQARTAADIAKAAQNVAGQTAQAAVNVHNTVKNKVNQALGTRF